jgi:hypothetical protein
MMKIMRPPQKKVVERSESKGSRLGKNMTAKTLKVMGMI